MTSHQSVDREPAAPSVAGAKMDAAIDAVAPIALGYAAADRAGGHYRWLISAMLFFATTVDYIDRQVVAILAPQLETKIGWDDAHQGYIVTAF